MKKYEPIIELIARLAVKKKILTHLIFSVIDRKALRSRLTNLSNKLYDISRKRVYNGETIGSQTSIVKSTFISSIWFVNVFLNKTMCVCF